MLEISFRVYVVLCIIALITYFPRILFFFSGFDKQKKFINKKKNRLAVLVPARDESAVISFCLDSLKNQNYDKNFYDIHVIVNDEKDKTLEIARSYTNTFVHVVPNQICKGDALDGAIKNIFENNTSRYDAFVIVDADNISDENFLVEMNNALVSGKHIVCGKKKIKNWESKFPTSRTWVTSCAAFTYINIDDMGNKFRSQHNIPISICGTGMMVRADVIRELGGWPYKTLIEDYEMTMDCILKGYTAMYYEHAIVYTEESLKYKESSKRRVRWVRGFAQCNKLYRQRIIKKTFSVNGIIWGNLDFLYGLWPLLFYGAASMFMITIGLLSFVIKILQEGKIHFMSLALTFLPLVLTYIILLLFTLYTMLVAGHDMKVTLLEKFTVLILNPIYILGWFPIYITGFATRGNFVWEKVNRVPFELHEEEESIEFKDE